jgi:hypothetical protein
VVFLPLKLWYLPLLIDLGAAGFGLRRTRIPVMFHHWCPHPAGRGGAGVAPRQDNAQAI